MPTTPPASRPAAPSLHMLTADEPLPMQAARWLLRDWPGDGPLDLRSTMILIPTQGAGRRLRQALAWLTAGDSGAATASSGVLMGPVLTPGTALKLLAHRDGREPPPATAIWLAYATALMTLEQDDIGILFPSPHLQRSPAWAMQTAAMLVQVRDLLAESGSDASTVVESGAASEVGDGERWRVLRSVERHAREQLLAAGWHDPLLAQRQAVEAGSWPDGMDRLVVVAVPDPVDLARRWWQVLCPNHPVEVLVYAPPGLPDNAVFDAWGRPDPATWQEVALPWEEWPCSVESWSRPAAAGRWCANLVQDYGAEWSDSLAFVVPDAAMAGDVAAGMNEQGVPAEDLQAQGWNCHPWRHLLQRLTRYIETGSAAELTEVASCNPVVGWLRRRVRDLRPGAWLGALAKVQQERLPTDAEGWLHGLANEASARQAASEKSPESEPTARRWQQAQAVVAAAELLVTTLQGLNSPEDLAGWLAELAVFDDEGLPVAEQAHAAAELFSRLPPGAFREAFHSRPATALQGLTGHLERCGVFGLAPESDRPQLNGWLEALWEDAPHLVVAGLHEGAVPETVTSHPFLPESLRERLNLKKNRRRHARDAYLLACLLCGRGPGGRTDIALIRQTSNGDPLKPSRLLFQGPDESLAARVRQLFSEPLDTPRHAPPAMPWQISPGLRPATDRIRVTAFADYLRCPFRYYLKQVLNMRQDDLERAELDAMQFGNVIHDAWEGFCQEDANLDLRDEERIGRLLVDALDRAVALRFGKRLPVAVQVQLDSARNRLRAAAAHQAATRMTGWRIVAVEEALEFDLGGITVRGKIDRIEARDSPVDGMPEYRVLDYKTSDKAKEAEKAHLTYLGKRANPERHPPISLGEVKGATAVWSNLQLPLYVEQLRRQHGPEVRVSCGYFNLPKAAAESGIDLWRNYSGPVHEAAMKCAGDVVAAVREGRFWPPNEDMKQNFDEFSDLILQSMEASIDPDWPGQMRQQWRPKPQGSPLG